MLLVFALMALALERKRVMSVETLLANVPELGDPTLGSPNGRFYFNARAPWDLFRADGKISDPLQLSVAVVLPVTVK